MTQDCSDGTRRNLKAAQTLGMETIREWNMLLAALLIYSGRNVATDVPLGGSLGALKQLEQKLGIDLTSGYEANEFTPSRL